MKFKLYLLLLFLTFKITDLKSQTPGWAWAKSAGGISNDDSFGIAVDNLGNSYITGDFQDTATFGNTTLINYGYSNMFLAKYDSLGNLIWVKQAGGVVETSGRGIAVDDSGNSYITGTFYDTAFFGNLSIISRGAFDIFIAKYDSSGNILWVHNAGGIGNDFGTGISVNNFGNVFITGDFNDSANFGGTTIVTNGGSDIFVAKYNSAGNLI